MHTLPPPTPPLLSRYYSRPDPPRSFLLTGIGWTYGLGCGAGPFFGMGVAVNRRVVFGAGVGVGMYCGVGFGAGALVGAGTGFVPVGWSSSVFYAPRIGWLEDWLERFREGGKEDGFWRAFVWPKVRAWIPKKRDAR